MKIKKEKDVFDVMGPFKGSIIIISAHGFMFLFLILVITFLENAPMFEKFFCETWWCGFPTLQLIPIVFMLGVTSLAFGVIMVLPLVKFWGKEVIK